MHCDDVIAVHPDAGETVSFGAVGEGDPGLHGAGHRDGPVVVLAEKDHRRVVRRGENHRLVHVAFRAGSVAEVHHDGGLRFLRLVRGGVGGRKLLVPLDAHGVANGMRSLCREDQGVKVEVGVLGVPAAIGHTAELAQQLGQVDVAGQGDPVLAVRGEDVILRLAGPSGSDLGGLLAGQGHPQGQLPLALERGCLLVEPPDGCHVRVEPAQLFSVESVGVGGEDRVLAQGAVRPQELDHSGGRCTQHGLGFRLELVVYPGSVELGSGQMCGAHTVSLLAAPECVAISLGYMPGMEYIPDLAYILAYCPLLYPQ
ncbi:hypothetical protein D9M72_397480 [compost metagenome]